METEPSVLAQTSYPWRVGVHCYLSNWARAYFADSIAVDPGSLVVSLLLAQQTHATAALAASVTGPSAIPGLTSEAPWGGVPGTGHRGQSRIHRALLHLPTGVPLTCCSGRLR